MSGVAIALIVCVVGMWLMSLVIAFCLGEVHAYRDAKRIFRGLQKAHRSARVTR